jgi:Ni/Fe-hydrogenase subunit HybB-like protein
LCAFLTIFIIRRFTGKWIFAVTAALWLGIGFLPFSLFSDRWELFLSNLPVFITIGVAALLGVLFIVEIKKLVTARQMEATDYAIG